MQDSKASKCIHLERTMTAIRKPVESFVDILGVYDISVVTPFYSYTGNIILNIGKKSEYYCHME